MTSLYTTKYINIDYIKRTLIQEELDLRTIKSILSILIDNNILTEVKPKLYLVTI